MESSDLLAILIAADRVQRSAERDRTFAERVQRSAEICKGLQTGAKSAERGAKSADLASLVWAENLNKISNPPF